MAKTDSQVSRAVLITGSSSGIGRATALHLVRMGFPVYATARRTDGLVELAAAGCRVLPLDVTDETSMRQAVAIIEREHGAVGVLINNAGYSQSGAVEEVSLDKVRKQFETNVFGLMRLTQLVLPGMRSQGFGKVINVSSMGGELTFPGGGVYHASKHAIEALSDALRFEVRGFGIDVVVIQPGLIRSGFSEAAVSSMAGGSKAQASVYTELNNAVARSTVEAYHKGPLAKLAGEPEDVAAVIAKAIQARRPKARYRVTGSARLLLMQRRMMSDRVWDAFLRTQFPEPRRPAALAPAAKQETPAFAK